MGTFTWWNGEGTQIWIWKQVIQQEDSDLEEESIDLDEEENIEDADNLEMSAFIDEFWGHL